MKIMSNLSYMLKEVFPVQAQEIYSNIERIMRQTRETTNDPQSPSPNNSQNLQETCRYLESKLKDTYYRGIMDGKASIFDGLVKAAVSEYIESERSSTNQGSPTKQEDTSN